ncbi:hypothetical protein C8F01DRAFT_99121 [Mycena amicta]|nr:hypothetical protein C8F01DRAFT_99121 [Mycena amicta]
MNDDETDDQRRNPFLSDSENGNGNWNGQQTPLGRGHRVASQPPNAPNSFASPPLQVVPASLGSGAGVGGWGDSHGRPHLLSFSTRSASFSSVSRFGSTFEDDELVDPDEELYDAHYGSYTQYRGRPTAGPPDLCRSCSQSLATAPVGSGRSLSLSSSGHGYNPNAGIGSAANSYVTSSVADGWLRLALARSHQKPSRLRWSQAEPIRNGLAHGGYGSAPASHQLKV